MIQRWGALEFSQKFRGGPSIFTHELRGGLKISYLEIREGGHGFYPTCSKIPHLGDSKLLKYIIKTLKTHYPKLAKYTSIYNFLWVINDQSHTFT